MSPSSTIGIMKIGIRIAAVLTMVKDFVVTFCVRSSNVSMKFSLQNEKGIVVIRTKSGRRKNVFVISENLSKHFLFLDPKEKEE